jgi:signal transduction histidine kinase
MELFYDSTVKQNPHSVNAPYFLAEMSIVKAYQGDYGQSNVYLDSSRALFNLPEEKIPYISYFIAAGMNAEHSGEVDVALKDYGMALKKGNTQGLYLIPPELYYAHALVLNHQLDKAAQILGSFKFLIKTRAYSAVGYYYYKYKAELLKTQGDQEGYGSALETFYAIKDSLGNLNHYRAIQEIESNIRLRDKEQQIVRLDEVSADRLERIRKDRIYLLIVSGLSALVIFLLIAYGRNSYLRRERQHRIDVMQGAMDAEEGERRKIADELHDEVGAMLSLATLNISSTLENGHQTEQAEKKMEKTLEVLGSVSGTIRSLSHRLTPMVIEKYGFRKAIEDLTFTVNLSEKLAMETVIVGFDGSRFYPAPFLHDCYRILQEMINNILKHAKATTAHLEVVEHEGLLSILLEDNGIGLEVTTVSDAPGKGLQSIRSRIAYLKGNMEITRQAAGGTLIVMEIPTPYPKT